jgi:hypothetical protein
MNAAPDQTNTEQVALPARCVQLHALGHLARVLEIRFPGILDEWVASLEDEALMNEVVRLRGPRAPPEMKDVRASALAWGRHVRFVTLAAIGYRRQKKRKR